MKKFTYHILSLFCCVAILMGCAKQDPQIIEVQNLAKRVLGDQTKNIRFEIIPASSDSLDCYELEKINSKIVIRGNNANALAVGLNHYLKYFCFTDVSWNLSDEIVVPDTLPVIPHKITVNARCEKRFFLNYCTFGYTMPYWEWDQWERVIDWMALNGINMPLAITGQESIWYNVWQKHGLSDQQIRSYFTGPAHLPWHRMTNVDYWQGPLPKSWLEHQADLQKQILKRQRALGMTPVLPAFSGHVPKELKEKYPEAKISTMSQWGGFDDKYRSHFLDPMDSLFMVIQKDFLDEQTKLYGTDHYYGVDPFNEVDSPDWSEKFLQNVSNRIYESLTQVDDKAVWVQMTWMLYHAQEKWTLPRIEAFMKAVPQDKLVLLDYYCDSTEVWKRTSSYFGQPFIWCYLGNFGGNTMLAGNIDTVATRINYALQNTPGNLWGIGSTLEGFDMNPIMYEFLFEQAWSTNISNEKWIEALAKRRGGLQNPAVVQAWKQLYQQVYVKHATAGQATLTNARPLLVGTDSWNTYPDIHYANADLYKIWKLLTQNRVENNPAHQFDVVNVGRQVLGNYFSVLRDSFNYAYQTKDLSLARTYQSKMMTLLDDMETLLASNESFLMGKWIADARRFGSNEQEKAYYEQNARNIVTVWGQKGSQLNDYANRAWSGLMSDFYKVRWFKFTSQVITALESNSPYDPKAYHNEIIDFEWNWVFNTTHYPEKPVGDALQIAADLCAKYELILSL